MAACLARVPLLWALVVCPARCHTWLGLPCREWFHAPLLLLAWTRFAATLLPRHAVFSRPRAYAACSRPLLATVTSSRGTVSAAIAMVAARN